MSDAVSSRFEIGGVISKTFAVIGRHFVAFAIMALILAGLPSLLSLALPYLITVSQTNGPTYLLIPLFLVQLACTSLLQGALTHATITDLGGQGVSAGMSLSAGFRVFLPLLAIGLLVGLGVGLGAVLLLVPGLLLLCRWAVASPIAVAERIGVFGSMGRSAELTSGYRWPIFGLIVVYAVALIVLSLVEYAINGAIGDASIVGVIVSLLVSTIAGMISSTGIAAAYVELRRVKEGAVPEALASIFD